MEKVKTESIEEKKANLEKAIQFMADDEDIKAFVKKIESGIPTTKGNYGSYMAFLSQFSKDRVSMFVVSRAMLRLGADSYGISWALKILSGN